MKILIISLLSVFVFVSCKDFCTRPKLGNNIDDSVTIPGDYRCFKMRVQARRKGKKMGFCYNGPLFKGIDKEAVDPDPVACEALIDAANEECKKLPPDPSQMNKQALHR